MTPRLGLLAATLLAVPATAPAAVLVLANRTDDPVTFTLSHKDAAGKPATLASGECRAFAVGRSPAIAYTEAGKPVAFQIEPYAAYVFTRGGLSGIELVGKFPAPDDTPDAPPPALPVLRFPVKLLADDADPRAKAVWEKALRDRLSAASDILEAQVGVRFEVADVGQWEVQAEGDLPAIYADFVKRVKPAPGFLAVGYTTRFKPGELHAGTGAMLTTHVLLPEYAPRTEPERVELLVHELARVVGAVLSPDPLSAMRTKLGDGKAALARFRVGLDPLNALAVAMWAEQQNPGRLTPIQDLPEKVRDRLLVVYRTLAKAHPDNPPAANIISLLDRNGGEPMVVVAQRPEGEPMERRPRADLTPLQDGVRKVVLAVSLKAASLKRLPDRPKGDALAAAYIQAAAEAALTLDEGVRGGAFAVGLGVALDDSTVLRDNPLTAKLCRAVEPDDERRERLAVLGVPTVRFRRDLCQHFAVSAALTEVVGPAGAEAAGLAKEMLDMRKPSGFSFTDLAADYAGVAFATKAKADPKFLAALAAKCDPNEFVPGVDGLKDGLSAERFAAEFGGLADPRFKAAVAEVRRRVGELPALKP